MAAGAEDPVGVPFGSAPVLDGGSGDDPLDENTGAADMVCSVVRTLVEFQLNDKEDGAKGVLVGVGLPAAASLVTELACATAEVDRVLEVTFANDPVPVSEVDGKEVEEMAGAGVDAIELLVGIPTEVATGAVVFMYGGEGDCVFCGWPSENSDRRGVVENDTGVSVVGTVVVAAGGVALANGGRGDSVFWG